MGRDPKKNQRGRYRGHPTGTLSVTRFGYGFVMTTEGEFFIPRGNMHGAMDGDFVEVRVEPAGSRGRHTSRAAQRSTAQRSEVQRKNDSPTGRIVKVINRAHETLVGRYEQAGAFGVVVPEDTKISYDVFVFPGKGKDAQDGDVVVVRLTTYPNRYESASGYIEEVVGRADQQGMDIEVIIRKHGLETVFSAGSLEQAAGEKLAIEEALHETDRRDIRDRFVFTIDPVDARDFDDAISIDYVKGQLRLGVHIADVSSYVPWESSIDLDARRRATSVYLPDRVIPMLPERLSNDLCSLRPDEDRLAFTVDLYMRSDGSVERYELYPSVIRSQLRLDYDAVQRMFDGMQPFPAHPAECENALRSLNRLAKRLFRRRVTRGTIDFESVEAKVDLDEEGKPYAVRLRQRTEATSMIEEAMILANETVATHMLQREAPMVYRVHDEPFPNALTELLPTLQEFGYAQQGVPRSSHDIQAILDASAGHVEHALISSLLLRAMKRAHYATRFTTHFGLASSGYTHFTSPIRRYPDLLVHRLLREQLLTEAAGEKESAAGDFSTMVDQLPWLCEHSSTMEREAEQASYEALALKLCEYMAGSVGEQFEGIITGVNSYGLFIKVDATTAEGLIRIDTLSEGVIYDAGRHMITGEDTGVVYRLGQRVRVRLISVDCARSHIDFKLERSL